MSTMKEILEREHSGGGLIHLHREGAFWKAYQKSAYLVHKIDPNFKVKKNFVKVVNAEIVSLGFPEGTLKRLFRAEDIETLHEKLLRIKGTTVPDEAEYQTWFAGFAVEQPTPKAAVPTAASAAQAPPPAISTPVAHPLSDGEASVLKQLREFRIEEATPISCMNFLVAIRKELNGHGSL